jgi:2,3-bisphosphoglycerate-dependent phosphoglycerate mutase
MGATLVLLRHGQSDWNKKNIFTGWVDVELSAKGREEAEKANEILKRFKFDAVFTSKLKRAQETARLALGDQKVKYIEDEALNERHYGELQGKNKDEVRALFGPEQVQIWRRSYKDRPPGGESLEDTCNRVLPYFEHKIKPLLEKGKCILIAAHGNSLRALIKYLDHLTDQEIVGIEIPTGVPLIYRFNEHGEVTERPNFAETTGEKHGR